jgi:hypothetical protein
LAQLYPCERSLSENRATLFGGRSGIAARDRRRNQAGLAAFIIVNGHAPANGILEFKIMRMTGFDIYDVDLLDEEYLGPPPRFLVESNPRDFTDTDPEVVHLRDGDASPLDRLKTFLGIR